MLLARNAVNSCLRGKSLGIVPSYCKVLLRETQMHPARYEHHRGDIPQPERTVESPEAQGADGATGARAPPAGAPRSRKLIRWPAVQERTGKSRTQCWR